MTTHRTRQGDMIDEICKAHYGTETMTVAVYEANPGLAALGPILPEGLEVQLPDQTAAPTATTIRLWD